MEILLYVSSSSSLLLFFENYIYIYIYVVDNNKIKKINATQKSKCLVYGGEPTLADDKWDPHVYIYNSSKLKQIYIHI